MIDFTQIVETTGIENGADEEGSEARDPRTARLLRSGELADYFQCAPRTINKWIDSGRMRGFRLPGSSDRRVTRKSALFFARQNNLPTNGLEVEIPFPVAAREALENERLTTGLIALILEVAPRTVSKWFDSHRFKGGYRIPGSQDRRVPRDSFFEFCEHYDIPLNDLLMSVCSSSIFGYGNGRLLAFILSGLRRHREVQHINDCQRLEMNLSENPPAGLIIEPSDRERSYLVNTLGKLRRNSPDTRIFVVENGCGSLPPELTDERFSANANSDLAVERICTLLGIGR